MEVEKPKTRGEVLEGIAFQFCKVATVALVAGRWTLPVAAFLCAAFYIAAFVSGKRDTRCRFRYPLLAAAVYATVGTVSLWLMLRK